MALEYLEDYDDYIVKLLKYMNDNNGTHAINKERALQWVNAQPIKEAKNVAKKLIDVMIYVTFEDMHKYIEKLITTYYKKIQDDENNVIHMFMGEKDKSNYYLSMLGLYYIKKHKYREPTLYFIDRPYNIIKEKSDTDKLNYKLIYIDDKTYSGGQIEYFYNDIMLNIYNRECVKLYNRELDINIEFINVPEQYILVNKKIQEKSPIFFNDIKQTLYNTMKNYKYYDIEFLLLGVNNAALDRITINKDYKIIFDIYKNYMNINIPNDVPFKIVHNIYYGKNYKTLDYYFTEEELFYLGYFFALGRLPPVAIYYDHKIADPSSTFIKILNYGPVVPINYDIAHYWYNFKYILNKYTINQINTNYFIIQNSKQFYTLCHKYYKKIINKKYQNINLPIKCIPFINNCYNVQSIIKNPLFKHINYVMFILIDGLYKPKFNPSSIPNNPMITRAELINKYITSTLQNKIDTFITDIDMQRCNLDFYKQDFHIIKKKRKTQSYKTKISKQKSHKTKMQKKTQLNRVPK